LDGVLFDVGVSSPQLDDASRGFSFQSDGPLDMRMDPTRGVSAAQWLAVADEKEIADVLWRYGEEKMSRKIARAIVERRGVRALASTRELADLVTRIAGHRERHKHPATRTFQALRIHVNDELNALKRGLEAARARLKPRGRLAVISFHSLEDRRAKQFIAAHARAAVDRRAPFAEPPPALLRAVARSKPSAAETAANPRARSAILRVAERTGAPVPASGRRNGRVAGRAAPGARP
jgi:16S rRNA (cytosine1402-N4)-methyltransferase